MKPYFKGFNSRILFDWSENSLTCEFIIFTHNFFIQIAVLECVCVCDKCKITCSVQHEKQHGKMKEEIQENEETDKVFLFNGYLWDWKYHWEKPLMNANWQLYRNKALNDFYSNKFHHLSFRANKIKFIFASKSFVNLWWDILSCCLNSLHLVNSLIKMKSELFFEEEKRLGLLFEIDKTLTLYNDE